MIESVEKLNDQAVFLAHEGSLNEALACFARAITLEKNNYLLWFNLGITYRDVGDLSAARNALEKSYHFYSRSGVSVDEDVLETLALVCFDMGDYDSAADYCYEGLEENPENPHLWNTIGVIDFKKESYDEAAESFEMAIFINPFYYDALYNLRDTYRELENYVGAAEIEKRIKEIGEK